jgi:DnaJ-class molecular chaperone
MLYSEFLKTLLSLKLKVPTKNWPANDTQTNTKSIESQLKSSFMRYEIAEAFEVLSDRNKRAHYDELMSHEYNNSDAN